MYRNYFRELIELLFFHYSLKKATPFIDFQHNFIEFLIILFVYIYEKISEYYCTHVVAKYLSTPSVSSVK